MAIRITKHAREENSYTVSMQFSDEDGTTCTCETLTWTLTDMDGNIINGRDGVSVTPSATTETVTLTPSDTTIVSGQNNERLFLAEWTYNSDYGTGLTGKEQAIFIVNELLHIT